MYRHHPLLTALSIFVLVGSPQTLASSNTSTTGASLRVGDYTTGDQLSNGTALPLYTLVWRAVGNSFSSGSVATNQTFAKNANTAFLDAPHTMTYTIINIQNAAASNTTRKLNGDIVDQISDPSKPLYSSVDLLLRATFTQDSIWEDLGVTEQTYRQQVSQNLVLAGWNMTAIVPMSIEITTEAADILNLMPLPSYSSYQVILQMQNLITDTLLTLLASDHVFLALLTEVDETSPVDGVGMASMTYIVQKAAATADVSTALGLVLGNPGTVGSQAASAFSLTMSNHSINATATVLSQTQLSGDSIQDQIYALAHVTSKSRHLGAIIGSSVASAVAVLLLLVTAVLFGRGWLKKRRLQRQAAAWRKEQDVLAEVENGKASFHDSGSSLTNRPSPGLPAGEDPTGTNCWDIDASDIVICQRPDGDKWLLNTSESGEVYRAVRGGVQDVVVKVLTSSTNLARKDLRKEVEVLKFVSYDRNVVQFYGTCPLGDQTMLVLEYMEGGDLRHALTNSSNAELTWRNKGSIIALDVVRGLHFLHSHGVMHMDLKANNVLLTKTLSIAKIGDVDLAQVMGSTTLQRPRAATFAYSAPELILNSACTEKVDMYSFGVILWELITTEVPRRGRLRAIKSGDQVPEECPAEIEQLIDLCLATEPADRPTAKQAFDIISSCSPHLAAPSPPAPTPAFHQSTPPQPDLQAAQAPQLDSNQRPEGDMKAADNWTPQHPLGSLPAHTQSIELPSWHSQGVAANHELDHAQAPRHQVPLPSYQAEHHTLDAAGSSVDPPGLSRQDINDTVSSGSGGVQHQLLAAQQELHNSSQHAWWPSGEQQAQAFPAIGQDVSAPQTEEMVPLGVHGHLYPSPFAVAVDDSSGPLWTWHGQSAA